MKTGLKTQIIVEESAKLVVPSGSEDDPFHKLAFYNPRMRLNRSISSLALGAIGEVVEEFRKGITLVDGLCATGARGIRYALENKFVKKVFFVDANEHALALLGKNIALNKLAKKSEVTLEDFNEFLKGSKQAFDFVEIDPFGTPAPFIKNALAAVRNGGVISVTATDLAALTGREQATCVRNYASKPMRGGSSHETSLRIVMWKIAREAAGQGKKIAPLFSFYHGHAVKTMCKVEKSAKKGKEVENEGYFSLCRNCLSRESGKKIVKKCRECGKKMDYAGPLWIGKLCNDDVLREMVESLPKSKYADEKQLQKLLFSFAAENELPPFFVELHELGANLHKTPPKTSFVLDGLRGKGFAASPTHFSTTGVRTDAPVRKIAELFG